MGLELRGVWAHLSTARGGCSPCRQLRALWLSQLRLPSEIPDAGWFKQRTFISRSSESRKSKIRVQARAGPGESPLPGVQMTTFFLCLHTPGEETSVNSRPYIHLHEIP